LFTVVDHRPIHYTKPDGSRGFSQHRICYLDISTATAESLGVMQARAGFDSLAGKTLYVYKTGKGTQTRTNFMFVERDVERHQVPPYAAGLDFEVVFPAEILEMVEADEDDLFMFKSSKASRPF
jgi:hypothetical protein